MDRQHRAANRPLRHPAVWWTALAVFLAFWVTARPAPADILVTRDGARVETDGPWKEKGHLVVFTRPDGTLSSLRLSEVDLEASRQATEQARRQAEREAAAEKAAEEADEEPGTTREEPRRPSRWSFTDADFSRRRPAAPTEDEEEAPATTGEAADDTSPPEVANWERQFDLVDQHVILEGTVANNTNALATAVGLQVSLYDEAGELIESRQAQLDPPILKPGQEASFRTEFPDVFTYNAVRFQTSSTNLAFGDQGEADPDDGAAADAGAGGGRAQEGAGNRRSGEPAGGEPDGAP